MKYTMLFLFALLLSMPANSNSNQKPMYECSDSGSCWGVFHTIKWERGVNNRVVNEWASSLDKISNISSTTYIKKKSGGLDRQHKKGHRDVIVWVPDTTNLTKDFTVVVWFHGHRGYVPNRTFQDRTLKQFLPHAQPNNKPANFVLVIPEMPWSVHTSTPTSRNGRLWTKSGDFMYFINQIERILIGHSIDKLLEGLKEKIDFKPLGKIDYRIVGHSAGGSTIKTISKTGDLCKINVTRIVWSDSSYGPWLKDAWSGCIGKSKIPNEVFVRKGNSPWKRAITFLETFSKKPKFLHLHVKAGKWTHKKIGNNVVELSGLIE